jgi:hypothetical protein
VGIIDDRLARLVWPNDTAIGKRFPAQINDNVAGPFG